MLLGFTYGCDKRFIVLHVSEIKCYNIECVCLSLRYWLSGLINISLCANHVPYVLNTLIRHTFVIRSDEGLTLETSAFQLVTVAKLHFQLS